MYGVGGERRLTEFELDNLPGYEGSKPVRVGNAASEQFQLDVYGEVAGVVSLGAELLGRMEPDAVASLAHDHRTRGDDLARARRRHLGGARAAAALHVFQGHGVGRVRPRRANSPSGSGWRAPLERWTRSATRSIARSASGATTRERRTFTQYYGSQELDASVLNIPLVGFLPGDDERVTGTIDAVRRELGRDGFVSRYSTADTDDGLPGDEGAVPRLLVLAGQRARAERPGAGGPDAVRSPARRCATISGCSPRSTTSGAGARSGTSRRRSVTWP